MSDCIEKINDYLKDGSITYPLFVNVKSAKQKNEVLDHFCVGEDTVVHISDFAKKDSIPNVMAAIDSLKKSTKNVFVFELTTYLRLIGNNELLKTLQTLSNMTLQKKAVIVCYHCDDVLNSLIRKDIRLKHQIVFCDAENSFFKQNIIFIASGFSVEGKKTVNGIENLPSEIEAGAQNDIYVNTSKSPKVFSNGQYAISLINTPLQILQEKYPELSAFRYSVRDAEHWDFLLKISDDKKSFKSVLISQFGDIGNYEFNLQGWDNLTDNQKWLLFISMKVYPDGKNKIICDAVKSAKYYDELMRSVIRAIIEQDCHSKSFGQLYLQWRSLRYRLHFPDEEIQDYCDYVDQKGKDAIYYLTDLSKQEKEKAIKVIGTYQDQFSDDELKSVLSTHFKDFYAYITPFFFNDPVLDDYFSAYNMQKLRNVIYPDFAEKVVQQAKERHFVELPSRAEVISGINKRNTVLFFVDALGVEFLNYIMQKCKDKGLFAEPKYAKCNLPSITDVNKEFIADFAANGADIFADIKQIDKDKHEAIGDYNFEKSPYPIHLIDELMTIDQVITNISGCLASNKYESAFIVSDHGASRLAVINKSVLPIESKRTGTHGGRVSEANEITKKLPNVVIDGELCMLAGYDRFDGSRPAAVETHGGATLEETVVPIIKITRNKTVWEFKVMNDERIVKFSFKKEPILIIWSKNEIPNLTLKFNNKLYVGTMDADKKTFRFLLDKPERACDCSAELFVSNNLVDSNILFRLEREGMQKNSGIGFGNMGIGGKK